MKINYFLGEQSPVSSKYLIPFITGYFWKVLNPDEDSSWRLCNPRALYSLPYHLLAGGFWKDLEELLCNLYFIRAKIEARMVENLLDDYYLTNTISKLSELKQPSTISARNVIKEFEVFVAQNCHILKAFPQLTLQQALNQPNDSIVSKAAFSTFRHESQERHPLIVNWINKPDALSCCQLTLCLSKV